MLLVFGVDTCVALRTVELSSAAVCVRCWLWFAVVVGVCFLALWGLFSLGDVLRLFVVLAVLSSVLFLFLLATVVDFCALTLVVVVGAPIWCPVASARPGASFFWWLCLGVCC